MDRKGRKTVRLLALNIPRISEPGMHADGNGLYLLVGPSGAKSWIYRYRAVGKLHDKGLGPLHTVSLAEARAKALECRKMRLDGIDPIKAGKAKRLQAELIAATAMSFEDAPNATSPRTEPAGATPSTRLNGRAR